MKYFNRLVQKQLLPVQQFVKWNMMLATLSVLSNEKVRLYAARNRGLSLHRTPILPTWYSAKKAIQNRKPGQELVYVDIPMCLLFSGDEPFFDSSLNCHLYKLKGEGLRFAKRSCRTLRVA
ncbi:hypothetical protein [Paenibacillus ihuae]|uniref:hypothetical protein n=1 Tax=Paenibacillus ihuae TaxID=1232431 RepID=UPI0006D5A6A5|nr:hypothetical protein [Paenibacillus ihuae]